MAISFADNWLHLLRLELTVYTDDKVAVRLYKKHGFVIESSHRAFAEATSVEEQRATFWSTKEAIDAARQEAEKSGFQKLIGEIEKLWGGVIATQARAAKGGG